MQIKSQKSNHKALLQFFQTHSILFSLKGHSHERWLMQKNAAAASLPLASLGEATRLSENHFAVRHLVETF